MKEAVKYNNYLVSLVRRQIIAANSKKSLRILDFGAGIGTYADMLSAEGHKVDCLEIDRGQIKHLKDKGYSVYDSLDAISQKYDLIYAFNVFEHIENDIQVFDSLAKKLKANGVIIIYVPAFPLLFSSMDKLVGHYRRYKLARLKGMAKTAGLNTLQLGYGEPIGFFAALAYKVFGNKDGIITSRSVSLYDKIAFPVSRLISPLFKYILGKNALLIAQKGDK